jgi:cytochrome c-type biogenesis protein CcmH
MSELSFYIVLLMLLASCFVILPVWRYQGKARSEQNELRRQQNIQSFEQNMQELSLNLHEKLLTQEEYETLKLELEHNFLEDMESQDASKRHAASSASRLVPLLLMLFIPVASFLVYREIGSSQELALPSLVEELGEATTEAEQLDNLRAIAAILDQRFQRRQNDIRTGFTLGTLYISLDQFSDAVRVFSSMVANMEPNADKASVLGQLAQAQYLQADSSITPAVQATMDEALEINSNEQAIMSLLAFEAFVAQDYPGAINYWRRQISQLTPGSPQVAELNQRIATIEDLIGLEGQQAAAGEQVSVTVLVNIDESIRDQIEPGMRLYVFARSEEMPVPLAARDLEIGDFPVTVTLDESMAMMPQFSLASVSSVFVGATIAREATAQQGGFRAVSESYQLEQLEAPIELIIKDPVP